MTTNPQDTRRRRYVATIHFVNGKDAVDLATWTLDSWQAAHDWVTSRDVGDIIRPYVTATIITEERRTLQSDRPYTGPWWQPLYIGGYRINEKTQSFVNTSSEPVA